MKKIIITLLALSSLNFACSSSQDSTSPAPMPSQSPVALYPNIQFWVVDDYNNNLLDETTDGGQTYSETSLLTTMSTIGTVAVSGANVALLGLDSSNDTQLDVSTDGWNTHSTADLSSLTWFDITNMNLAGSNILLTGSAPGTNIVLELSTNLGQSFSQLTVPNTVLGQVATPGGISFDGSTILLKTVYSGSIYLYYSADLQNYVDLTPQLATGACSGNEFTNDSLSEGNFLGGCLDLVLFTNAGQTQTDLAASLAAGDPNIQTPYNDIVAINGSNLAIFESNGLGQFAAYSQDLGITFSPLASLPPLQSHTIQTTCFSPPTFMPTPCTRTINSRINTAGLF